MEQWAQTLGDLLTERGTALKRQAYLLCGNDAQADDLVQDALERAFTRPLLSGTESLRDHAKELLVPLIERIVDQATATGRVRADFSPTDLPMIFTLGGSLSHDIRPGLWRRYVDAVLDGFMTSDADRVGPGIPAPTQAEIERSRPGHPRS